MRWVKAAALAAGLAFVLCAPTASARPARQTARVVDAAAVARINDMLSGWVNRGALAGASALIYEDGRERYFAAFGMADREAGRAMARDTIVQIWSMTKPITGVALMQLYEQGRFRLDDPLAMYAPEFADLKVYAGVDSAGAPILEAPRRPVTIRDLTRHTAGFAGGEGDAGVGALFRQADPMSWTNTLAEMARRLGRVPLAYQPGARWLYSPAADVQAHLVERLSGQPFDRYVQEHILDPLRMRETRYFVPPQDRGRLAAVYDLQTDGSLARRPDAQAFAFNVNRWPMTPGGYGFTSTLDDYMRFARMLLNGGELNGVRILRRETVRLMATDHLPSDITERSWLPSKGQVGFGVDFAVRIAPAASATENVGAVGEFFWDGAGSTLFWVDPANDLAAVLFVQLFPFSRPLHKEFRDAVYGPYVAPAAPQ